MKDGSILHRLEAYAKEGQELNLEALREQAESKCKPGSFELTEDAIQEARESFFDVRRYENIVISLRNKNSKMLLSNIMAQYNAGIIDLEKLYRENATASLASLYPHYKNHLNTERLLLLNPTIDGSKTTFVHELFSNNSSKDAIIHFFKELNELALLNPELMSNYLALSDTDGKSIRQLLEEKSLTQSYLGIAEEIKGLCRHLYPRDPLNVANAIEAVGTHTASIHGSVDKSFVRLASNYDKDSILESTERELRVDRNTKWSKKIETDFTELEQRLRAITESDESITQFIMPTLVPADDQELACKKFKFQAETALRMIDGLKSGRYGNHLSVLANENVSCGLTPKEIVAIGYASLKDVDLWNNPELKQQHFIQFIESLYVSKRGYNIDAHGENEWARSSPEADDNKCTGGAINQIATGLRDHLDVEVKVITPETMGPILFTKLSDTLGNLSSSPENKDLIDNWLITGTINERLSNLILVKLKEDEEFSQEFSQSEIETIGARILNKLKKEKINEIQQSLQNNFPEIFPSISLASEALSDKGLVYSFSFKEGKGYVPYLESLYHIDRDRFNIALQNMLTSDITDDLYSNDAQKMNLMLSLLLSSQDEAVAETTKEIFQSHVETFNQEQKNQYFILMAEQRNFPLLTALKNTGADVNARDSRFGHNKNTALCQAAEYSNFDTIDKLVELGADINAKDDDGRTVLHYAVIWGRVDAIAKLVELGADIHCKDSDNGRTALHHAALRGYVDAVVKLVELGADINDKDGLDRTPLHMSFQGLDFGVMAKLVELGADTYAKDRDGKMPLDHVADICAKDQKSRGFTDYANESSLDNQIARAVIKNKSILPEVMNIIIKQASGYIKDDAGSWRFVEKIIENLPQTDRLEIVSKTLKGIDNTSRRDRLLSFIPEEERNLARAKVSPTMWESVREAAELMHGNSSVDVPKRPGSYAEHISGRKDKGPSRF